MKKVLWVLCLGVLLAAGGCASEPAGGICQADTDCPSPQACVDGTCVGSLTGDVEIADNVQYLEQNAAFTSLVREPDRLIFTFSQPADLVPVEVDDIIVGIQDGGYLRRVESVQVNGNQMVLNTRIAGLGEAIQGHMVLHIEPNQDFQGNGRYGSLSQPAMLDYDLSGKTLLNLSASIDCGGDNSCTGGSCDTNADCDSEHHCDHDDNPGDGAKDGLCILNGGVSSVYAGLTVTIERGYVRFDPGIDVETESGWFSGLKKFHFWISGQFDLDMDVKATATVGMSHTDEVDLWSYEKRFLKFIGWFPVEGKAKFAIKAGYDVRAEVAGSVTSGFDAHAFIKAGGQWNKGAGWSPVWEQNFSSNPHDPTWALEGTVTVKVWLKPDVEVLLYETAGPAFNLTGYLKWKGWFLPVRCWKLFWGFVAAAELRLGWWLTEGLGLEEPDPWNLYDTGDQLIAESCSEKVCKDGTEEIWLKDTTNGQLTEMVEDCAQRNPAMVCDEGKCIEDGFGDLAGRVEDALTHNPIQGATIEINKRSSLIDTLTSDAAGAYSKTNMEVGTYTLHISAPGYIPATVLVEIKNEETTYVTPLRQLPQDCDGLGSASGKVLDAVTGQGLPAEIEIREGVGTKAGPIVASTNADADGNYTVSDLPSGNYTAEVRYINYATNWADLIVCGYDDGNPGNDDLPDQNIVLSPLADGNFRIVLTWGETPKDVDAHLYTPSISGQAYHIFYRSACRGDRDAPPYADLDIDDRNSFGPETITIAQFAPGTYNYIVHNYGGQNDPDDGGDLGSGRVQVFDETGNLVRTFYSPGGGGYFWNVFSIDGATKAITPINTMGGGSNPHDYPDPSLCFPQ